MQSTSVLLSPIRFFALQKHTSPVPTTSPLPKKKKIAWELSSICDFVKAPMLLETIRNDDFHRITAL